MWRDSEKSQPAKPEDFLPGWARESEIEDRKVPQQIALARSITEMNTLSSKARSNP